MSGTTPGDTRPVVLHIAGGFAQSPVYARLVDRLCARGCLQAVYGAVRSDKEASFQPEWSNGSQIRLNLSHILGPLDRILFRRKIRRVSKDVRKAFTDFEPNLIHAHTLYSDGAVAERHSRRFGIPYIVAVRNTDLNVFSHLRPDLQSIRNRVLRRAGLIVCITPAYRERLRRMLSRGLWESISAKTKVIPNGIDDYWLDNPPELQEKASSENRPVRLLFVGTLNRGKNVLRLINAVSKVREQEDVTLTLVGPKGNQYRSLQREISGTKSDFVTYLGHIKDQEHLKETYRTHDIFAMPTLRETFGLVYVEALSQGLPILCSRGEGVDGFFNPETVSESADPVRPTDIANKIESLIGRADEVRHLCVKEARRFDWDAIASRYIELYRGVIDAGKTESETTQGNSR